ncbi:IS4 family transposase [Crocosphaera watsonii]|uniref:Transposase, IS4 family n=4 Tax=Crocosphaera watsonii TaxID=263511 RepID=G5IXL8_CROWT|nr:IS4 family transposase [Crocosphaera watsonii]EHJ15318.1 Transposase, IS4 family [Crocosphaera watsonii WH 0003]
MKAWVSEELKYLDLGDKRLNTRLGKIVSELSEHPHETVPQAIEKPSDVQATYEFWENRHVKASKIIEAHKKATIEKIKEEKVVLAVQDTTDLEFAPKKGRRGLGSISKQGAEGLKVHNVLAVSGEGIPYGLLKQKVWARVKVRKGKGYVERKRKIEEKESFRWIESLREVQEAIPEDIELITVCDREGDIFELLSEPLREGSHLLIRAAQDRRVKTEEEIGKLFSKLEKLESMAEIAIKLRRTPRRKPRIARLQVKWTSVEIQAPLKKPEYGEIEAIKVNAIVAEEIQIPKGEKAVKWVLLTTLAVNDLADAQKVLKYYTYRWLIERFHYVLKTGCGIEKLMLDKGERLERALATYSIIASRILWLKYCAVEMPDEPADIALEEEEWQVLYCVITKKKELPSEIPTIYECVRWIGRLGGFMCRKGDGEPGVQTLWKGWQRLSDYLKMWMIIKGFEGFIQI